MRRILLLALLSLGVSAPAMAAAPCTPFTSFPLAINFGSGANTGSGEDLNCALRKVQAAVNAVPQIYGSGVDLSGGGTLSLRYAATKNPNAILFGVANSVSFAPSLSTVVDPTVDHQRTSALFSTSTQDDGHSQEQTVGITTTIGTGYYRAWTPSTSYAVGDNVNFQDSRNSVYRVTKAGVSAASGIGPSGKTSDIVDGSVRWAWVNDAAINAKVGLYNEVDVVPGAGNTWAQANNILLRPGVTPLFNVNTELDFTNNSGTDCAFGVANCNGLYIRMAGSNRSTAAISTESLGSGSALGLRMVGPHSTATMSIDTAGQIGLAFNHLTPASYSVATINDAATAPVSLNAVGTNSLAAIRLGGTTPVGIDMRDASLTGAQVLGKSWSVNATGSGTFANMTVAGQVYEVSPFVPTSSTNPCAVGQHSWDANYEYRCVATNTWKRAALSTW